MKLNLKISLATNKAQISLNLLEKAFFNDLVVFNAKLAFCDHVI
ncbi:hypothetical protein [Campylobacter concisus]|nr:hypothetical protein [Campylobacter concisus]